MISDNTALNYGCRWSFNPITGGIKHFNFNEKNIGQEPLELLTFISGCMWLIPRRIFKEVGFINEEYFMYVEDLEFSHRVLKNGYKLKTNQNSNIWHKVECDINERITELSVYFTAKNKIKFIKDNFPLLNKITSFFFISILFSIRLIYKKRSGFLKSHLKGIRTGFRNDR